MRIKIAARQSDLARLQAQTVGRALQTALGSSAQIEYAFRASLGDLNLTDPLWKMPEKGVFTEDFLQDLIEGRCDLVVHSWKDLPTEARPQTDIVATLPRADARDLLLFRRDRLESVKASGQMRVLTSSPRRTYNLDGFFKSHLPFPVRDIAFENVRGNIPTRMRKLLSEDVDALILAKAAVDRLLQMDADEYREVQAELRQILRQCVWMVLPFSANPTAAAQGALAIEIRRDRKDLRELLDKVNCPQTFACVERERKILASYGGGCHQKIGVTVLRRAFGEITYLRGLTDAGEVLQQVRLQSPDSHRATVPPVATTDQVWPSPAQDGEAFFKRVELAATEWQQPITGARFLWVARAAALPTSQPIAAEQIVWCAGLQTWRQLALRGIWVNGTAEGLGETEPTRIETLLAFAPGAPVAWLKLTHETSARDAKLSGSSAGQAEEMTALATYRLVPLETVPDLRGKTHFFWMSGSAFTRALELYPEIRSGHHACGPGKTYQHLRSVLGEAASLTVYLSREDWRRDVVRVR